MNTLSELDFDAHTNVIERCGDLALSSVPNDISATLEGNAFVVSTVAPNYWSGECAAYDRNVEFQLKDVGLIKDFKITQLEFDDYLWVKINQNTVYVGPDGGDKIELMGASELFAPAMKVTNGISLNSCERFTVTHLKNLDIDLKPYLHNGINTIWARTIVGGYGDSAIYMAVNGTCEVE